MNCSGCGEALRGRFCTGCGLAVAPSGPPVVMPEGDWIVVIVRGPISAGQPIAVGPGYRFHAFVGSEAWSASPEGHKKPDRMTWTLESGQHLVPERCDLGAFVRVAALPVVIESHTKKLTTQAGDYKGHVVIQTEFRLADVFGTVKLLGLSTGIPLDDVSSDMQQPVGIAIDMVLSERLGMGTWSINGLESGAQLSDFCRAIEDVYNTNKVEKYFTTTAIRIPNGQVSFTLLEAPKPLAPGSRVMVTAPDGNRYPAIVQQVAEGQALVAFAGGGAPPRWVPSQYVTAV